MRPFRRKAAAPDRATTASNEQERRSVTPPRRVGAPAPVLGRVARMSVRSQSRVVPCPVYWREQTTARGGARRAPTKSATRAVRRVRRSRSNPGGRVMNPRFPTRRRALRAGLAAGLGLLGLPRARGKEEAQSPPVRLITRGPKHHWFGYYDKLEFDPTGRYVLGMEVDFEHRAPRADDLIHVGMVDLHDKDRWIELGRTTAWCWQQGCMLQWLPGSKTEVLWNDREGNAYVCRVLDLKTKKLRTVPHPVYAVSPDGRLAIATDFRRLADTRPGYGYNGIPDPNAKDPAPRDSGVFRIDLTRGKQERILSFAGVAGFGTPLPSMAGAKHKFNHLLFNPAGSRFAFLHRWTGPRGRQTRLLTATPEGKDLRVVDDNGMTSHYIWRDARHILAYSEQPSHGRRFYLFEDGGKKTEEGVGQDA